MPVDPITTALRYYERKQDDEPAQARLAEYEWEALGYLTDRDELLDALGNLDRNHIEEILRLIVSAEDDTELGRLVREPVEHHVRSQNMFASYIDKRIVEDRERRLEGS